MIEQRVRCRTCWFWNAAEPAETGECRRSAPSPVVLFPTDAGTPPPDRGPAAVVWPQVASEDWCGEHEPRNLTKPAVPAPAPEAKAAPKPAPTRPATPRPTSRPAASAPAPARPSAAPRENKPRSSPYISGLSSRTKKVVDLLGVKTWEELAEMTTEHVREQKGTGPGTINELRQGLSANGFAFVDER